MGGGCFKVRIQFSKKLIEKLRADKALDSVMDYCWNKRFLRRIVKYALNWKYKSTKVNLVKWLNDNKELPEKAAEFVKDLKKVRSNDAKVRQILCFVNKHIHYLGDIKRWKVQEYWQTPKETMTYLTGDCEDGSLLIYLMCHEAGIPDDDLWLTCGNVVGGGHAYVIYRSEEDLLEYPIDWCYWFDKSKRMQEAYFWRDEYYQGSREWFRFNLSDSYIPK
jgi:predicted transglutaminase-like cysteine proteinase